MESDNGRCKDQERTSGSTRTDVCTGTGVEASHGGHTQTFQQRLSQVYGRTECADGTAIQELTREGGTVALDSFYINTAGQPRLMDDWMNPWEMPGEHTLNTIKEKYAKIKKRLFSQTNEDC